MLYFKNIFITYGIDHQNLNVETKYKKANIEIKMCLNKNENNELKKYILLNF